MKARLDGILGIYWADTAKAHVMHPGGGFARIAVREGKARFEAQAWLMENPEGPAPSGEPDSEDGDVAEAEGSAPEAAAKAYIGS